MKNKLSIVFPILVVVIIIAVIIFTSLLKKDYVVALREAPWYNRETNWRDFSPVNNSLKLFETELKQFDKSTDKAFNDLIFNEIEIGIVLNERGLIIKDMYMRAYKLYMQKDKHILYEFLGQSGSEIQLQGFYIEADKYNAEDIAAAGISAGRADLISKLYLAEDILKSYDGDYINIVLDKQADEEENCYLISNDVIQKVDGADFDFQTVCFSCGVYKDNTLQGSVSLFIRS